MIPPSASQLLTLALVFSTTLANPIASKNSPAQKLKDDLLAGARARHYADKDIKQAGGSLWTRQVDPTPDALNAQGLANSQETHLGEERILEPQLPVELPVLPAVADYSLDFAPVQVPLAAAEEHVALDYGRSSFTMAYRKEIEAMFAHIGSGSRVGVIGVEGIAPTITQLAIAMGSEVTVFARSSVAGLKERTMKLGAKQFVLVDDDAFDSEEFDVLVRIQPDNITTPKLNDMVQSALDRGRFIEFDRKE